MASRSSNKAAVPEAKGALDKFKYEVATELGVPLTDGYNGDLTSKQNGSVGGYMVKKMIEQQEKQMAGKEPETIFPASAVSAVVAATDQMHVKKYSRSQREKHSALTRVLFSAKIQHS